MADKSVSTEFLLGTVIALVLAALAAAGVTVNPILSAVLWAAAGLVFCRVVWSVVTLRRYRVIACLAILIGVGVAWRTTQTVQTAHVRILGFEVGQPSETRPYFVNVFLENRNEVPAEMRLFHVHSIGRKPPDDAEHANRETEVLAALDKNVAAGRQADHKLQEGQRVWFSIMGGLLDAPSLKLFRDRELRLFFSGRIVYSGDFGERSTSFCASTDGRPRVFIMCRNGNEEK